MKNINLLVYKLKNIMREKWIKVDGNSCGGIGLKIESLLGVNSNNLEYPDFEGIEIKTKTSSTYQFLTLFHATPDNSFFEIKRIYNRFGYPNKKNKNRKNFNVSVYNKKETKLIKYNFFLFIDDLNQKVKMLVLNRNGELVESRVSWSFSMLENKFQRKFNQFCLINIITKKICGVTFFSIKDFRIYKSKSFKSFIDLIKTDKIRITFKIGSFCSGKRVGEIHDRGTSFDLDIKYVEDLFIRII